uniref:F-box domain-containing protein n=1 Tax=Aegilops tauschii subsp. strangulata TaxID=200361 RepID=A0A453PM58_AEGTS
SALLRGGCRSQLLHSPSTDLQLQGETRSNGGERVPVLGGAAAGRAGARVPEPAAAGGADGGAAGVQVLGARRGRALLLAGDRHRGVEPAAAEPPGPARAHARPARPPHQRLRPALRPALLLHRRPRARPEDAGDPAERDQRRRGGGGGAGLPNLTFLDISSCTKIGARALEAFGRHCRSLEFVDLRGCCGSGTRGSASSARASTTASRTATGMSAPTTTTTRSTRGSSWATTSTTAWSAATTTRRCEATGRASWRTSR